MEEKFNEVFGREPRTILGEEQWKWLEYELSPQDNVQATILVSSIQVFTRNPLTESWLHFPSKKRRLVNLLKLKNPPGFLILSGDIHIGQMISARVEDKVVEITSSGLTHDCTDGMIPGFVCEMVYFVSTGFNSINPYYIGKNFGSMEFNYEESSFTTRVHDVSGKVQLKATRHSYDRPLQFANQVSWPYDNATDVLGTYFLVLLYCFILVFMLRQIAQRKPKSKLETQKNR